eukprot:sb/3479389/
MRSKYPLPCPTPVYPPPSLLVDALGETSQAVLTDAAVSQPRTLDHVVRVLEGGRVERDLEEELEDRCDYPQPYPRVDQEERGRGSGAYGGENDIPVVGDEGCFRLESVSVGCSGRDYGLLGRGNGKCCWVARRRYRVLGDDEIPCAQGDTAIVSYDPDISSINPIPASLDDKENAPPTVNKRVRLVSQLPVSKIKKIMRFDPETVMVKNDAVVTMAFATELFVKTLATAAARVAVRNKRKTIKKDDIDLCVTTMGTMEGLERRI